MSAIASIVDSAKRLDVRFNNLEMDRARVADSEVRLMAVASGTFKSDHVNVRQQVAFAISVGEETSVTLLDHWVRPLHDMVTFLAWQPVRLTSLLLRPAGGPSPCEVTFEAVQRPPATAPGTRGATSAILLGLKDSRIPFDLLIPRWFQVRAELRQALNHLLAPQYTPFMFSEHRYAAVFQSAEALARLHFSGREKATVEHRARLARIIDAAENQGVPREDVDWARRILQSRNDKTLTQSIKDLVQSLGQVGSTVLSASPEFPRVVSSARAAVSHPNAKMPLDAIGRHWYGEVLGWIVRGRILQEIGLELGEVERRILENSSFRYALNEMSKWDSESPR